MKLTKAICNTVVALAAVGMLIPGWAKAEMVASSQPQAASKILDVALSQGGSLRGQLVTGDGAPVRGEAIVILRDGREVARTLSDEQGHYEVSGLRGGVHQIVTSQSQATCRLWTGSAAPPSAQPGALIVVGDTVRGNIVHPDTGTLLVLAIVVAAGVGWYLSEEDDGRPASHVAP